MVILCFFEARSADLGTTGLIDIPTARMLNDGDFKLTFSSQQIADITNLTYQATPWLETTFRYTIFNPDKPNRNAFDVENDRSYGVKVRLFNEGKYWPQVAVGIRDILGTGAWGSEYIVSSKKINQFDFSIGLGWGRLAQRNSFSNPFVLINDNFNTRDYLSGGIHGGKPRFSSFFRGEDVGVFGGLSYQLPEYKITLLAEYNSDAYQREIAKTTVVDSSPISYGLEWKGIKNVILGLSHQQGVQWGVSIASRFNTKEIIPRKNILPFSSSTGDRSLSKTLNSLNYNLWYDRLFYDLERSGIVLKKAQVLPESSQINIEISNTQYMLAADAINRTLTLSEIHLPRSIKNINVILNEDGFRAPTVSYRKINNEISSPNNIEKDKIRMLDTREITNPTYYTEILSPYVKFGADLAARFQLFDPNLPFKHQIFLKLSSELHLGKDWNLFGAFALDIENNFDTNWGPNSPYLPNVRTDVDRYLTEGATGINSLYFEKRDMVSRRLYYRTYMGILEDMYSGVGGELLYLPFKSRWALGTTINAVIQRDYNKEFGLRDYKTVTAFISLFYASAFYNYDLAIHAGRYLAKDKGATIEIRRTFENGFSIGAFATFTNVSAAEYGEGSFDKGLYFQIPFNSFVSRNTKGKVATTLRSLQRDGGQKLDDFTGRLWHDLRSVRYDSFEKHKFRMIPE